MKVDLEFCRSDDCYSMAVDFGRLCCFEFLDSGVVVVGYLAFTLRAHEAFLLECVDVHFASECSARELVNAPGYHRVSSSAVFVDH